MDTVFLRTNILLNVCVESEGADVGWDGTGWPDLNSKIKLSGMNGDRENSVISVQLATTSKIGNHTWFDTQSAVTDDYTTTTTSSTTVPHKVDPLLQHW